MTYTNDLYHHGVLGVKWGVRHGNAASAYSKASNKMAKLNAKVNKTKAAYNKASLKVNSGKSLKAAKYQAKADKYKAKAIKVGSRFFFRDEKKSASLFAKSNKYQLKADVLNGVASKNKVKESKKKAKYIRAQQKADKWMKAMNKEFSNKNLSAIKQRHVVAGRDDMARIVDELNTSLNG